MDECRFRFAAVDGRGAVVVDAPSLFPCSSFPPLRLPLPSTSACSQSSVSATSHCSSKREVGGSVIVLGREKSEK